MPNDSASPGATTAPSAPRPGVVPNTAPNPNTPAASANLAPTKSILASRTFAGLALIALPIVAAKLGWRLLDPATQQAIDDILQAAGWVLAAYGRLTAERPLHVVGASAPPPASSPQQPASNPPPPARPAAPPPPRHSLAVAWWMLGLGGSSPLALAVLTPGEWIVAAAASVTAIGTILAFIRREARQHEPAPERRVSGGPVQVALLEHGVERHEHDELKATVARQREETWEVINGLRHSVSKIEADIAGLRAQREANGERLTELSGDIKGLSKLVHRLAGIVETKLEAPRD